MTTPGSSLADPTSGRVWTFGEAMAALITSGHRPAEHASTLQVGIGGAEFNVAVGLARLGHPVTYISVVGDDPWGRRIQRELRAEGVDGRVRVTSDSFTGAYLREHRTQDLVRATYLRRGSAASLLTRSDIDQVTSVRGDVLHLTGLTPAISGTAASAWLHAAAQAHQADAQVSLDVNYRSNVSTPLEAANLFAAVAGHVHTVMASIEEAQVVTGRPSLAKPADAADALAEALPNATDVVIKNGAEGSMHVDSHGSVTEATALSVALTDLVGAGDAFAAGYLSGLLDGEPPAGRLDRGHACAAFVVSTHGDWEGAPRRDELALAPALTLKEVHR